MSQCLNVSHVKFICHSFDELLVSANDIGPAFLLNNSSAHFLLLSDYFSPFLDIEMESCFNFFFVVQSTLSVSICPS